VHCRAQLGSKLVSESVDALFTKNAARKHHILQQVMSSSIATAFRSVFGAFFSLSKAGIEVSNCVRCADKNDARRDRFL